MQSSNMHATFSPISLTCTRLLCFELLRSSSERLNSQELFDVRALERDQSLTFDVLISNLHLHF